MSDETIPPISESPLSWSDDGQPRSRRYDECFCSPQDGRAEAGAVFPRGCALPQAWDGRDRFVGGEPGFGTGLTVLPLIDLWARSRPPQARLHIFSIEAHPTAADDARRALGHWPELADLAARLTARWPGRARGG